MIVTYLGWILFAGAASFPLLHGTRWVFANLPVPGGSAWDVTDEEARELVKIGKHPLTILSFGALAVWGGVVSGIFGSAGGAVGSDSSASYSNPNVPTVSAVMMSDTSGYANGSAFVGSLDDTLEYAIYEWDSLRGTGWNLATPDTQTNSSGHPLRSDTLFIFTVNDTFKVRVTHRGGKSALQSTSVVDTFVASAGINAQLLSDFDSIADTILSYSFLNNMPGVDQRYDIGYAHLAYAIDTVRADSVFSYYLNGYVDTNTPYPGCPAPRQMQPDTYGSFYAISPTDSVALKDWVKGSADCTIIFNGNLGSGLVAQDASFEGRIQERALRMAILADQLGVTSAYGNNFKTYADNLVDSILKNQKAHVNDSAWASGKWRSTTTGDTASLNYMAASAMSALVTYYEVYSGTLTAAKKDSIQAAVTRGMEWMWNTQWQSDSLAFNYASEDNTYDYVGSFGVGSKVSPGNSVLNSFFLDTHGWLYQKTGDPQWIVRGDSLIYGLVQMGKNDFSALTSGSNNGKRTAEWLRSVHRYLEWRGARTYAHLAGNPIEIAH